jgi:deoxyribodipyrimidine photo-lyase
MVLPGAGEVAALEAWGAFRDERLGKYPEQRDRADLDATSRLSIHLKFGTLHPRTLLSELAREDESFRREIAWREFYGSVLAAWPESARVSFDKRLAGLRWSDGPEADMNFEAWASGRTGYPFVDAGMRQLASTGFMHNRVRMVVASFLTKDLHLDWRRGARHFMRLLVDGDLASNQHGWQWTAGTGTDAAPYYRVLNPSVQAQRFDPEGNYIRQWVPELSDLEVPEIYQPWKRKEGPPEGYPPPIVDHAIERVAALEIYSAAHEESNR